MATIPDPEPPADSSEFKMTTIRDGGGPMNTSSIVWLIVGVLLIIVLSLYLIHALG